MGNDQPQLNQGYVINSLTNQVANLSLGIAQKDSVIAAQQERIHAMEKELEQLQDDKVAELDREADKE